MLENPIKCKGIGRNIKRKFKDFDFPFEEVEPQWGFGHIILFQRDYFHYLRKSSIRFHFIRPAVQREPHVSLGDFPKVFHLWHNLNPAEQAGREP